MRKVLIAAALVFAAVTPSAFPQNSPWAQKIFQGVTGHDFGTCPAGAQLKHRFVMKNIYAVPLEITNIRSSCGCLSATPSTTKLQPKEEAYIDVVMDATRFSGHKTVSLFVTVGPQYVSTAVLQISGNARSDVVFNPGEINFGVVAGGATPTRVMDVEYAGAQEWQIVEVVKSKSAPFTVTAQEIFRQPKKLLKTGKVGYQLQLTLNANAPSGLFQEVLVLKTNDPSSPQLTVHVEGNIQAALSVTPDQVKFGPVKVGQKATLQVFVRGKQPFRIQSAEGIGNGIQAEWSDKAADFHKVNIHCQAEQAGEINRKLILHTDSGKKETLTVQVQANVIP